jgi:cell division protein FtsL
LDVEARAKRISSDEIRAAEEKLNRLDARTKFTTAIIGAAAAAIGILGTLLVGWLTGMQAVRNDVNDLKSKIDIVDIKKDLSSLNARIGDLEKRPNRSGK